MDFKEVVGRRRSIRFFQPWRPVEREKIQMMLEAAWRASRAVNAAFAKAIVVYRDQLSREEIEALKTPMTKVELEMAPVWILWFEDSEAVLKTNKGQTLHQLVDVGAINPTHGFSHRYVDEAVWPQILEPGTRDPIRRSLGGRSDPAGAAVQAALCAVDEGLGTLLTPINIEKATELFNIPNTWIFLFAMLVGYPAESWEAGGQRPREPFEEDFFEDKYGVPFQRDPAVVEKLKEAKMIQTPAPLPWRRDEVRALARMFGLPEQEG